MIASKRETVETWVLIYRDWLVHAFFTLCRPVPDTRAIVNFNIVRHILELRPRTQEAFIGLVRNNIVARANLHLGLDADDAMVAQKLYNKSSVAPKLTDSAFRFILGQIPVDDLRAFSYSLFRGPQKIRDTCLDLSTGVFQLPSPGYDLLLRDDFVVGCHLTQRS